MEKFDLEIVCKQYLIDESFNKNFKEVTTLEERKEFREWIKNLDYKQTISLFFESNLNISNKQIMIYENLIEANGEKYQKNNYSKSKANAVDATYTVKRPDIMNVDPPTKARPHKIIDAPINAKVKHKISNVEKGIAVGVVVAAALYAAYRIYKNYFSKAAKACKGKTGIEREKCLKQFKINAAKLQITQLKSHYNDCNKTNNPVSCKEKIRKRILKLEKAMNSSR